ncbi:EAL domain-containing protein [Roseateles sp.]|uniref:EAL domain-containing protein n=1 Tax=Roseateles sp. TaxID=1971397 RepID=UPI00286A4A5A|nr:EAL domain-containing protein [Roseateles sp.]
MTRKLFWVWLGVVAALLMFWLLVVSVMHTKALQTGAAVATAYVKFAEVHTSASFESAEQLLQLVQLKFAALKAGGQLSTATANALLVKELAAAQHLNGLWVMDKHGHVVYDTHEGTADLDLSDRRFFSAHAAGSASTFFIDKPLLSRRTGKWQLSVSAPMRAPDGSLQGVIAASIDMQFFDNLWSNMDLGPGGSLALLSIDGDVLMRSPFSATYFEKNIKHRPLFSQYLPATSQGLYVDASPLDGVFRTFAYKRSARIPKFVLVVGVSRAHLLLAWQQFALASFLLWVAASAALTWFTQKVAKEWAQRRKADAANLASEQAWRDMFAHSPVAQLLRLPSAEIVTVNAKFLSLSGLEAANLVGSDFNALGFVELENQRRYAEYKLDGGDIFDDIQQLRRRDGGLRLVRMSSCEVIRGGVLHHLHSFIDVTQEYQAATQAFISQRALAEISQGVLISDARRLTIAVNQAFETLTGYTGAELLGRPCSILQGPLTDPETVAQIHTALGQQQAFKGELLNYRKDGTLFWNELSINPVLDQSGALLYFVGIQNDITQRKVHEQQLKLTEKVFNQSKEGITITDPAGLIIKVNQAFTEITGYSEAEVLGKNPRMLSSGMHGLAFYQAMWAEVLGQGSWSGEIYNRHKNGTVFPELLTIAVLHDAHGNICNFLGNFTDLTQAKVAESHIHRLSHFDALTGLPNRTLAQDRTAHAISMALRSNEQLGMMLISLDHFKTITETMGHHVGDKLLIETAKRLSDSVRDQDTVSHHAGKEFLLMLPATNPEGAAHLAAEVLWKLSQPFKIGGQEFELTASIGIATFPDNGANFESIFKSAEIALHRAQSSGRDNYKFYSDKMYQDVLAHENTVRALRLATELGEFQVLYQPLADLQTGSICGMEALLRWHRPELGVISPSVFIPIAEQSGLMIKIGLWVLRQVCKDLRIWLDQGLLPPPVAVNVSPLQFDDPNLARAFCAVLAEQAITPALIQLEVTESALMDDVARCEAMLHELKDAGFRLSLDDFGTGYSSLNYLKRYPFDKVKIDQSFVRDIDNTRADTVIAKIIISMAHGLGLRVIAEGVETETQCEILRSNVCDEIQGYLFSRPVDAATLANLLTERHRLPEHLLRFRKPQRTLLLVDDEPNVVSSLKRLFRRDGHKILSASSGAEGLELLAKNQVDVIISDQRMPGMTGVEFLREAKLRFPGTIRIVLSGYTELQSVTDAINEGAVYRFLTKPWVDEQLREQIDKAFEHRELIEENQQLDIKIRTTNQELVAANRQLNVVVNETHQQVTADATSLAVVHEVLQYVPTPVIGLDDENIIVFANRAAEHLLSNNGPLLGFAVADVLPELHAMVVSSPARTVTAVEVAGMKFQMCWNDMGASSQSSGKLLTLAAQPPAP